MPEGVHVPCAADAAGAVNGCTAERLTRVLSMSIVLLVLVLLVVLLLLVLLVLLVRPVLL
jgi:hypothetical protein